MDELSNRRPATTTTNTTSMANSGNPMPGSNGNGNDNGTTMTEIQHGYIRLPRGMDIPAIIPATAEGYSLAEKLLIEHSRRRCLANSVFISIAAVAALCLCSVSAAKTKNKPAVHSHDRPDK